MGGAEVRPRVRAQLLRPMSAVTDAVVGGAVDYVWLPRDVDRTWLDALVVTVTIITTVGYGETKPVDWQDEPSRCCSR